MTTNPIRGEAHAALITAPGSGQGKSMVTAALARLHRNAGRRVRVFKHGPDYLDPMVQEVASGAPVYQLHPWMTGEAECRWRLAEAAREADLILVEGSMGLFDGNPSSADLAILAGLPALPVIDAWGMAQTFGAVAQGLANFHPRLAIHEVIANRVGSPGHGRLLADSMPEGLSLLGAIPRSEAMAIPDRHLGLVQAGELDGLDAQLDDAAAVLAEAGLDRLPARVTLEAAEPVAPSRRLDGVRIAVARDAAFAFIYRANLDLLEAMGAELAFFSPLEDARLPVCHALWLPGGYPELHAARIAANASMRTSICAHHEAGKPILAECGGLMACMESLVDGDGAEYVAYGLLSGTARMTGKLSALGLQSLDTALGELRGHTYHHSSLETPLRPVAHARRLAGSSAEAVYREGSLTASYFHGYFPSAPALVAAIFTGEGLNAALSATPGD
ncbi:MAG: cobyrinate a,c-diamide synthase [Pseudomonadota bacterium]